jgi:hypothetical protein
VSVLFGSGNGTWRLVATLLLCIAQSNTHDGRTNSSALFSRYASSNSESLLETGGLAFQNNNNKAADARMRQTICQWRARGLCWAACSCTPCRQRRQ